MMMVLVSLALATILASAYLASRDNSVVIGQNATASAAARWAALSAMETTVAVLQTETDWRTNHIDGVLIENYPLAGALITITARDQETGAPPTTDSVSPGGTASVLPCSVMLAGGSPKNPNAARGATVNVLCSPRSAAKVTPSAKRR